MDLEPGADSVLPGNVEAIQRGDFLTHQFATRYDLVVGNPPFHHAQEFVEKALIVAQNVVFLLRLGFLASKRRYEFWRRNRPARVFVLPKRPSFSGDGGVDRYDYCFAGWRCGMQPRTQLHWLPPVEKEPA
jgi:hypothetical protein